VADQKRPVDLMLDLFVYAPLGLLMNLDEVVPELVEKGHQQVNMARMFGQFAVRTGTKEARKRVEQAQEQVGLKPPAGNGPAPARATRPSPASSTVTTAERAAPAAPPAPASPGADELAIPDYDALSASQVVPRLAGLAGEELDTVRRYEAANRGRKTILSKIAQLQSA
jgi:hypothetical protein